MTITYKKAEITLRDDQPSHQELRVPGEGTAQSQVNEDNKPTSPGFESNRNGEQNINPGRTTIHTVSNLVVDGGSVMNGRIAEIGDKSRQRPKQNNRRPVVVESGSLDHNVCTVGSMRKGAEDPASFRQINHVNISPGAKFASRDMSIGEFLEYFCGRKT
ncbi:hypothetical protein N7471_013818 [Penicillium samsonianum]|uniref:uncharacterized protein n=1 Tax=Penicillium samsonianum TaxID=1882272 RepID=UPI0025468E79|nr:uncharacterized protein N7471_013818 [Penicillium samsonianum]KAJ6118351.1 hypothetical protein N7471_013818 [Penicillium samsonianum]